MRISKQLLTIFVVLFVVKVIISFLIPMPNAFSDDYAYLQMAKNFHDFGILEVNNASPFPPLYSILISPLYLLNDTELIYLLIKILNALISSAIIFPIFLIAKDFLNDKEAIKTSILISLIPTVFVFTFYVMSENIFFLLFTLSILFLYKLLITDKKIFILLAGFTIGLAYLSKILAASLFILELILCLYFLFKKSYTKSLNLFLTGITTILSITPYLVSNLLKYGFTISGLLGKYGIYGTIVGQQKNYFLLIYWMVLNLSFIFLATGLVYPISIFKFKDKNYKILLSFLIITSIVLLFMASELAIERPLEGRESRPIGRYLAAVYPLIILLGSISLKNKILSKKVYILALILLLISTQLLSYQLFPLNNMELTHLGVLSYILNLKISTFISSTIIFLLLVLAFYILTKLDYNKLYYLFLIFFAFNIILNIAVIKYNINQNWYNDDANQLGLWFNRNIKDYKQVVLLDESDVYNNPINTIGGKPISDHDSLLIAAYWIRNDIVISNVDQNYKYIFTTKNLNYPIIKQINDLKIYQKQL